MSDTIGLQFSYRMSYRIWVQKGFDVRERNYYSAFRSRGYEVAFISYDHRPEPTTTPEGIDCYGISRKGGRRLPLLDYLVELRALMRLISERNIAVLKANQLTGAFHAVPAKLLKGRKIIVRCGYNWMQNKLRRQRSSLRKGLLFPLLYLLEFGAYLFADRIVVTSVAHSQALSTYFPFFHDKTSVIRNHIDTGFYQPGEGAAREGILFVGRLEKNKNVEALIRASAGTGIDVTVVGSGSDEERLKGLASDLKIPVNFTGQVPPDKVRDLMQTASIFAFPTLYEGAPKALLEAMACEMVVVAGDVEGCRELVEDGVTGYLCDVTETALSEAIVRAAALDPAAKAGMGKRARRFVVENCSFDAVIAQELALIRSVLEGQ